VSPFLRRISTRRLILLIGSVVAVVIAGTAIAIAASSGGPKPPPKPLAVAVHDALAAPEPQGVTATISFKNRLIDAAALEGSDPLLSGGTGRLWAAPDGRFRIEVQSTSGDAQLVSDGKTFWAYDPSSNTVYRGDLPKDSAKHDSASHRTPTLQRIRQALARLRTHALVSGARPDNVGGQEAYDVRVSPKQAGGLFGGVALAWDAAHGVPLRVGLYARGATTPVLELAATDIMFGPVDSSALDVTPPAGAKTEDLTSQPGAGAKRRDRRSKPVTGLSTVQAALPFKLSAPSSLAGRSRQEVRLLGHNSTHRAALVTYGRGPGAIAVIQKAVTPAEAAQMNAAPKGENHQGLNLPTVSIDGTTAQELETPLGTAIRFTRGNVEYVVIGSVNRAAAESAARGL
jgi:outer membrane lipoprotein-sorting protein